MIYTGMTTFTELPVRDWSGEPVVGIATELASAGSRRLLDLACFALHSCAARGSDPSPVPLYLCLPETRDVPVDSQRFLSALADRSNVALDLKKSRLFFGDGTAVLGALAAASAALDSGGCASCYVGGVDSLVDPVRVASLTLGDRLRQTGHPDGFVPGEAAAFVRLSSSRDRQSLACLSGVGVASEPSPLAAGGQSTAAGMSEAIFQMSKDARVRTESLSAAFHTGSGERYFGAELALTTARCAFARDLRLVAPALTLGEVGAAAGCVLLSYLSFLVAESVPDVPDPGALALISSVGPARGALLVGPARRAS
jgi:3-oxoacyl-[acyl-carrier-protein] synthase-1